MRQRSVAINGAALATSPRAKYLMSPEPRPLQRGALCGWLWTSRLWLALSVSHVLLVAIATKFSMAFLLSRLAFTMATSWQTWASDRLHNLDLIMGSRTDLKTEFLYWRLDLFSIALILASQYALWSVSLHLEQLRVTIVAWGPIFVGAALAVIDVRKFDGVMNVLVKLVFLVQFCFVGYLGVFCNLYTDCGYNALIWFVYLPGFVCYLSKGWINHDNGWAFVNAGPHELFHVFVYLGHVVTMLLDAAAQFGWLTPCFA